MAVDPSCPSSFSGLPTQFFIYVFSTERPLDVHSTWVKYTSNSEIIPRKASVTSVFQLNSLNARDHKVHSQCRHQHPWNAKQLFHSIVKLRHTFHCFRQREDAASTSQKDHLCFVLVLPFPWETKWKNNRRERDCSSGAYGQHQQTRREGRGSVPIGTGLWEVMKRCSGTHVLAQQTVPSNIHPACLQWPTFPSTLRLPWQVPALLDTEWVSQGLTSTREMKQSDCR